MFNINILRRALTTESDGLATKLDVVATKQTPFLSLDLPSCFHFNDKTDHKNGVKGDKMSSRRVTTFPKENPFLTEEQIQTRYKPVRSYAGATQLVDVETGEVSAVSAIHTIEEKDEEHFVKIYAEGVRAAFDLTKTGGRIFQAILAVYQREKMTGGFVDSIHLEWFDGGLNGHALDMSERTFQRGFKELLDRNFFYPKSPSSYWINPRFFFKGNRVAFVREYRLKSQEGADAATLAKDITPTEQTTKGQKSFGTTITGPDDGYDVE